MTRRFAVGVLLGLAASLAACSKRYHSRVKFSLPSSPPSAGEPFPVTIDYMDDTDEVCEFVLLRGSAEVDRATLPKGARAVSLTAAEAGAHSVELRWGGGMIAHGRLQVR